MEDTDGDFTLGDDLEGGGSIHRYSGSKNKKISLVVRFLFYNRL